MDRHSASTKKRAMYKDGSAEREKKKTSTMPRNYNDKKKERKLEPFLSRNYVTTDAQMKQRREKENKLPASQ